MRKAPPQSGGAFLLLRITRMKRIFFLTMIFALACSSGGPAPSPVRGGEGAAAPLRSPNAITPIASLPKTIAEPRIRVGMLSDQSSFTFDRIDGGYAISGGAGAWTLRRGFKVTAPLQNAPVRYAVQVSAISNEEGAKEFVQKVQTETGQRVDMVFDLGASTGGTYRILVGDFPDAASANPLRDQLMQRGYAKEMLVVRRPSDQPFEKKVE